MKGFVKEQETADDYVKEWEGDPWYPAIAEAHDLLTAFIPGYQPVQIKSKFGGLRFYFTIDSEAIDQHDPKRELYVKLADAIVIRAELACQSIDRMAAYNRERSTGPGVYEREAEEARAEARASSEEE